MTITRNHQAEYKHWQPEFTKVIDGRAVRFRDVCVHEMRMGDVEDPDLMIAQPIWEWQQTDAGKWIMENSNPAPSWHRHTDFNTYGHIYQIRAYLTHKQLTYYKLKFE
jgi:hypothetical protein